MAFMGSRWAGYSFSLPDNWQAGSFFRSGAV
jgi:hypothetical protein